MRNSSQKINTSPRRGPLNGLLDEIEIDLDFGGGAHIDVFHVRVLVADVNNHAAHD